MPTTDGRISKIKLPNGKVYDVGSGGSGTVDSTWVTGSTNPVESQLIQNTKPGLINTSTHGEAFGNNTTSNASGSYSHVEGGSNTASGDYSHAQNYYTIASSDYQTAMGKYNVSDVNDTYALIIGNGTANNARSNALAIGWDGKIYTGNSNVGYTINELKTMIDSKPDRNENWGFLYNDNSTWSNGPWYKIADTSITTTHTDTNIVLRFQRAWNNTGISYGTLVVHARANQNDTGISSIQARWRDAGANLPYDQCVVTYTSNTSGGSTIQIWAKLQVRYDAYCYEKEVDDSRQSMTDKWTLYSYTKTDGETSYPTTQTVLQPSFGQQSLNQLTFYYDNFSTATSSSRYQKITFVSMDVEDSSMTSDKIIYIPKENGTLALVSDVEDATTVNPVSGTNGSVRFDYVENSKHKIGIDDGLQYNQTTGTASVEGVSQLVLGNSTQRGTAGNKTGSLKIYNSGGRCGVIDHDSNIKNTTVHLPAESGTLALLSDIPSVPTDYVPLGGTTSNAPVTGKIEFTGYSSYLLFDTNNTGVRFVDSSNDEFSGVAWNGSNFWLGARAGSQPTHAGKTYISTGWDTTNSVGYNTIAISIPRSKDGSTSAVTRYVIHTGDNTFNAEDTLDEAKEIKLNNSGYSRDIRFRATNSHADLWFGAFGSSNDGGGIYNIAGNGFVLKSSTASGSLVNTFYGNANSATAIKMNQMQSTSEVQRYLTLTPNLSGDATNQYANNGLWTESTYGSSSQVGYTRLHIGNTTNSGSAGNNRGFLYLHGPGANYATLQYDGTSNIGLSLPTSGGTLALKSEIKITNSTVSTSGSGNAITSLSISSGQLVATKGSTFMAATGNTSMSNTFEPQSNYGANLGSSSYRFNNLYVRYINGDAPTSSVTSGSTALVTSGGVYSFLEPTVITPKKAAGCTGSLKHLIYYYPALNLVVGRVHASIQALTANSNAAIFNIPSTYKPNTNSAPVYISHNKGSTGLRGWISSTASSGYVAMSVNSQTAMSAGDIEVAFTFVPATSLTVIS